MNRELYPNVKKIISNSKEEAKIFGDEKIRPEHIVLSILADDKNEGVKCLSRLNLNTFDFYDKLTDFVSKNELGPRLGTKGPTWSEESKKIIKTFDNECSKLNDDKIDTTHILLAILAVKSPLTTLFAASGVTYKKLEAMIRFMRDDSVKPKAEAPSDEEPKEIPKGPLKSTAPRTESTGKSKTPVLDNFARDLAKAAENGEIDPVIGLATEIKRVSQILSRRKKNNPVIIGEPGVGKTTIVEGIALLIKNGKASPTLANKRIMMLDLGSIVAGTKYRGQFEERIKAIIDECKANKDVILFLDELHTIIGSGGATGSLDGSNMLKPALARGEIQIIGATTLNEYRENIEKDGALTRRFQEVIIKEPSLDETKQILMSIKGSYETHHRVKYTDEAIDECVKLSARYIMDRMMPDKAIDVLDEAGSLMNITQEKPEELIKLEEEVAKINETKKQVVIKQQYEEAAKLRDKEKKIGDELTRATLAWKNAIAQQITEVGPEAIAEIVSSMTGIPLSKISSEEMKNLMSLDQTLSGKVIGQDAAVLKVVKAIKRNRIGIKDKNKPVASFIFLGKTGVGKTLLAKHLAEEVYGSADALIRMDMSEYMEKFSVSRLVGAPPGYVGHEQGGELTEKVRRNPHCVILFDEVEKAHPDVFNILLQMLDEGMVTDSLGRKINFKNALIILTSNIGVKEVNDFGSTLGFQTKLHKDDNKAQGLIVKALEKHFRPEFLNRIDEAIIFNSLTPEDIQKIIHVELSKLEKRIKEMKFGFKINKAAIDFIAEKGYDEKYGARPLNRALQRYIEDNVADEILNGNVKEGETISITFDKKTEQIVVSGSKK